MLIEDGVRPHYLATGHILFARERTLLAVPFDTRRLELTGDPFPLVENLVVDAYRNNTAQFAVSDEGTLAYLAGSATNGAATLVWVDRDGAVRPITQETRPYLGPRISPDGSRIALAIVDDATDRRDIWVLELERRTLTRLTFGDGEATDPIWDSQGETITFSSDRSRTGVFNLYSLPADGSGEPTQLTRYDELTFPRFWLPGGIGLVFHQLSPSTSHDIGILSMAAEEDTEIVLGSRFGELHPSLSSDGRWLAYVSDESGRWEVYVRGFRGPERKLRISTVGGLGVWILTRPSPRRIVRFAIPLEGENRVPDEGQALPLSSDGQKLAYATLNENSQPLYVRSLDQIDAIPRVKPILS